MVEVGVGWVLGKGSSIRFWEDVWIFDEPLCLCLDLLPFINICKARFGFFVPDYWQNSSWVKLEEINVFFSPIQ